MEIPEIIFNSTENIKKEFLIGVVDVTGSIVLIPVTERLIIMTTSKRI